MLNIYTDNSYTGVADVHAYDFYTHFIISWLVDCTNILVCGAKVCVLCGLMSSKTSFFQLDRIQTFVVTSMKLCVLCGLLGSKTSFFHLNRIQTFVVTSVKWCVLCRLLGSKMCFFHLDRIQTCVATSTVNDPDSVVLSAFLTRIFLQADRSSASSFTLSAKFNEQIWNTTKQWPESSPVPAVCAVRPPSTKAVSTWPGTHHLRCIQWSWSSSSSSKGQ